MVLVRLRKALALAALAAILGPSCTHGTAAGPKGGHPTVRGGKATFGAENWPQCLNPLTSCNFATGFHLTIAQQVLPKLMMLDQQNEYVPSPLLTRAPSLGNGLMTASPFKITYKLNRKAVWDDGSPITSKDIRFTWLAILHTKGSDNPTGYDLIKDISTPDARTAVLSFKEPYAAWADLFGGGNVNGYVLKRAAFKGAKPAEPNLENELIKDIPFSGGPWKLQSWSDERAVLVRNAAYWGRKPLLDRVTFVPLTDTRKSLSALRTGKVAAIYLSEAPTASITGELAGSSRARFVSGPTPYGEALWLNLKKAPLDDPKVREALAYAVDRQSVVNTVIRVNDPRAAVLQCLPPVLAVVGKWCDQTHFAKFRYSPQRSLQILSAAGWSCSTKPCTKNGEKLTIVDTVLSGAERSVATGRVIRERAMAAGFDIQVKENEATDLFINKMPKGDYQMADLSLGGVADPSQTGTYACSQIPTESSNFAGANTSFWCNEEATRLMEEADHEIHPKRRLQLVRRVQELQAREVVAIPLYSVVAITAWRTDLIGGPIGEWNSAFYGTFFNMDQWSRLARSKSS